MVLGDGSCLFFFFFNILILQQEEVDNQKQMSVLTFFFFFNFIGKGNEVWDPPPWSSADMPQTMRHFPPHNEELKCPEDSFFAFVCFLFGASFENVVL